MLTLSHCQVAAAARRFEQAGLAALGAAALAAAVLVSPALPRLNGASVPPARTERVLTLSAPDGSLTRLRDAAEQARAELLGRPGVGAVTLRGLVTTGLEVEYAPARLARSGVTVGDLRAAVPAQSVAPGRIVLSLDAAQGGPQPVADRIVHGRGKAVRLGDVATVARVAIAPVSTLSRNGHPAVELVVLPAPGVSD